MLVSIKGKSNTYWLGTLCICISRLAHIEVTGQVDIICFSSHKSKGFKVEGIGLTGPLYHIKCVIISNAPKKRVYSLYKIINKQQVLCCRF